MSVRFGRTSQVCRTEPNFSSHSKIMIKVISQLSKLIFFLIKCNFFKRRSRFWPPLKTAPRYFWDNSKPPTLSVLPEVAISRRVGYFCDMLCVKESPWRFCYFVAIFENEHILSKLGILFCFCWNFVIFFAKPRFHLEIIKNFDRNIGLFGQIRAKSGYFWQILCRDFKISLDA